MTLLLHGKQFNFTTYSSAKKNPILSLWLKSYSLYALDTILTLLLLGMSTCKCTLQSLRNVVLSDFFKWTQSEQFLLYEDTYEYTTDDQWLNSTVWETKGDSESMTLTFKKSDGLFHQFTDGTGSATLQTYKYD